MKKNETMPWDSDITETPAVNQTMELDGNIDNGFKLPKILNKKNIKFLIDIIFNTIKNNENYLGAYIQLKAYEEIISQLLSRIKNNVIDDAYKYGKDGTEIYNAKVQLIDATRRYDYSEDKKWRDLKVMIARRETFLKGINSEVADVDTGEIIKPAIIKFNSETIRIIFKDE